MILAYLSNHISPSKAWLMAFFGLTYPYLLLANTGFLVFWWWRKNKYAFISLIIILVGFSNIGRYIQFNIQKEIPDTADKIKVVSYNVRIFNYYLWENKNDVRDNIFSFLKSEGADFICLQEFLTKKNVPAQTEQRIGKELSQTPHKHIEYTKSFSNGNSNFGLATFSRYPILNRGKIDFNNSVNTCIYSDVKIKEDTFRIYNLHLQSIHLKKNNYGILDSIFHINSKKIGEVKDVTNRLRYAFIKRAKQADLVEKHISSSPYPVILCGDFNDTPVSYTYSKLLGERKDAYREAGFGTGKTYRGKLPSYRIDYIFYSQEFDAVKYESKRVPLSDHYPVSAEFIIE